MRISEWLKQATDKIDRLDAELIATHVLGVSDRSYLVAHGDDELAGESAADSFVSRRMDGEPLAYILGYREFYGRRFFVTPDVLIPRPESETIIDMAKSLRPEKIVDVGTGSGCLAVTLALELPDAKVVALDVSDEALSVAQKNAAHHSAKVEFHKSDLLSGFVPEDGSLIVANLPYVDANWDWLDRKTLSYEPSLALYAEDGGLALIFRLVEQAPKNCTMLIEADPSQHDRIVGFARRNGRKLQQKIGFILQIT